MDYFKKDYQKFSNKEYKFIPCFLRMLKNYELRFLYFMRKNQKKI